MSARKCAAFSLAVDEADQVLFQAPLDDLVQADEGAAGDEQDVLGVDLQEFLVGVLAPAQRRHVGHGALDDLEQRLLHALAGDVAGDGGVLALARDLVQLVDVDDALLGQFLVFAGGLVELQQDVLHVLADVAGFGQGGGVGHGERHVQDLGQGLGQQRLAGAGRPDQQDVALADVDLGQVLVVADALVVVVDGHGQFLLGRVLGDDVLVELALDLGRGQQLQLLAAGSGLWALRRR